jgi:hypothetical protein
MQVTGEQQAHCFSRANFGSEKQLIQKTYSAQLPLEDLFFEDEAVGIACGNSE